MDVKTDELDVLELFQVFAKYKTLIFVVLILSAVISAVISLLLPRTYEAVCTLLITPSKIQSVLDPAQISLNAGERRSTISLDTHRVLLISDSVLEKVALVLGQPMTLEKLKRKIKVYNISGTNLIQIKASDRYPQYAKRIIDVWSEQYIDFSQQLISGELKGSGEFLTEQFYTVKQNLQRSEETIKQFDNRHNLDLLKSNLTFKQRKLMETKNDLVDSHLALKIKQDQLTELKKQISNQSEFLVLSKALSDESLLLNASESRGTNPSAKVGIKTEEINPVYQNLKQQIVNAEVDINTLKPKIIHLEKVVTETEQEVLNLEKILREKQSLLVRLNRENEIYRNTYQVMSVKVEDARIAKAVELGEVKIVSPAFEPKKPIESKRRVIVLVSTIISLFICTIGILIYENRKMIFFVLK